MGDRRAGKGRPVNLNAATKDDLTQVRGLSEDQIEHIIRYRRSHGRFSDLRELRNIPGCSEVDVGELEEWITVGRRPARD